MGSTKSCVPLRSADRSRIGTRSVVDWSFGDDFVAADDAGRRQIVVDLLRETVVDLAGEVNKRGVEYDATTLVHRVDAIAAEWLGDVQHDSGLV